LVFNVGYVVHVGYAIDLRRFNDRHVAVTGTTNDAAATEASCHKVASGMEFALAVCDVTPNHR
jgi:hypothetical protein